MKNLWKAEPVLVSLVGSVAVWGSIFAMLAAFNHPLTLMQQSAITGLVTAVGAIVGRSQVTPTNF